MTKADARRKALLAALRGCGGKRGPVQVIRFRNQDVPRFLRKLTAFERTSEKTSLMIAG